MQARYELYNKLNKFKSEIEIQIKNIALYKSSKIFNQNINKLIPQFDITLKQIPKTISFRQDQKPVALQDFLIKFQQKIEHRKESLLNRYLREIEQIKTEFIYMAKKATSESIDFIENSQQHEQRFKRQLNLRRRTNLDSINSLKEHQKNEKNLEEIKEKNEQIKINEEKRINSIKKNELKTIKLQIEQLKQEINDQKQSYDDDLIEKKRESNQQKFDFIKKQKNDEIDLIKKQISIAQSDIKLVKDRILNFQMSQNEAKNSFQSMMKNFESQINQQTRIKISQIEDEIESNQTKISALIKKIQNLSTPLNKESFEKKLNKELAKRKEKLKSEENRKKIELEEQIIRKINEYHSVLKEIFEIESKTEILKEKIKKENQLRIERLRNENKKEIDEINNELIKLRSDFNLNSSMPISKELILLQTKLTDYNIKIDQLDQEKNNFDNIKDKKDFNMNFSCNESNQNEFLMISESFFQKEINNINKTHLIINELKGQLDYLLLNYYENAGKNELKEFENIFNQINQEKENLFKFEKESNFLFLSIDFVFDMIDELQIKIDNDEKEKERLKKLVFDLKEKQKNDINKLYSINDELNKQKISFLLSNNLKKFESEFIEKLFKEIELIKNAENEMKNIQTSNEKEIIDDDKILYFFKRKEIETYYEPIINLIKEKNKFIEELMKFKLKITQREMLNDENDLELICQLNSEISNLERNIHELESFQSHVNRKVPLPPLKDS